MQFQRAIDVLVLDSSRWLRLVLFDRVARLVIMTFRLGLSNCCLEVLLDFAEAVAWAIIYVLLLLLLLLLSFFFIFLIYHVVSVDIVNNELLLILVVLPIITFLSSLHLIYCLLLIGFLYPFLDHVECRLVFRSG